MHVRMPYVLKNLLTYLQLILGGTESTGSTENFFGPPKKLSFGGSCSKMLYAIPQTYFCVLSPLDLAYRDKNVPIDLRNCWGGGNSLYIGSYIPHPKSWGTVPRCPPRFLPLDMYIRCRQRMTALSLPYPMMINACRATTMLCTMRRLCLIKLGVDSSSRFPC